MVFKALVIYVRFHYWSRRIVSFSIGEGPRGLWLKLKVSFDPNPAVDKSDCVTLSVCGNWTLIACA